MRSLAEFIKTTLIGGVLVLVPIYLITLLILKALAGLMGLISPITEGLPQTLPSRELVAILTLVAACFVCGVAMRTGPGLRAKNAFERTVPRADPGLRPPSRADRPQIAKARAHPVDVPFTLAVSAISKWGEGSSELLAGMKRARLAAAP